MPPSGFNRKSVRGALQFIGGCYEDLTEEVRSGKHKNYEEAFRAEIRNIKRALSFLHINKKGQVVKRKPKR